MNPPSQDSPPRTLREARPGDHLEVRLTLFEFAEAPCWGLDLETGDRLECIDRSTRGVLVAHPNGNRQRVPDTCARFVAVQRLDAGPRERRWGNRRRDDLTGPSAPF